MNMITKNNIFERYLKEYLQANRDRKGDILDHVSDVTEMHRKASVRKFRVLQFKDPAHQDKRGRRVYYDKAVDAALRSVWEAANEPCGELLHPIIDEYVSILKRDKMWKHNDEATGKLHSMSEHTVRRRVSSFRNKKSKRKGLSATKPSHLKSIIPIFKGPWNDKPPGHGQLDTVAHCGNTLLGDFVYTVNYTDAATYWIIPRAQWNKGQEVTLESMKGIEKRLPVLWLGAHPDTGSEFINWATKEWFNEKDIEFTRSEPGKKNDNMYVEERNGHVVRKYLGYTRLDNRESVSLINKLFDILALYLNHFQPVRRTLSKKRVGAKYVRTYEKRAKTPYQRMLEHEDVPDTAKEKLRAEHEKLNPLVLKKKIDTLISKIMKMQKCDRGTENGN